MAQTEEARWLAEEVQPHEAALRRFLQSKFPSLDPDDVVQESYLKILKAKTTGKINSTKAYFFTIARNAALTVFRRGKIYSPIPVNELPESCIMEERPDASEITHAHQRLDLAVEAIACLPPRCRQIFTLAALEHLSPPDIAARLGLSEATVYVQIARGVRDCRAFLQKKGERP